MVIVEILKSDDGSGSVAITAPAGKAYINFIKKHCSAWASDPKWNVGSSFHSSRMAILNFTLAQYHGRLVYDPTRSRKYYIVFDTNEDSVRFILEWA